MTVTLTLPPEKEAAFKAQAQARGLSVEQWMLELADQSAQPASVAHLEPIPKSGRGSFVLGPTATVPTSRSSPTRP